MTSPVCFPIENFSSAVFHVGTAGCIIDDDWRGAIERRLAEVRERQRAVARVDIREANALRAAVKRVLNEVPAHHCGNTIPGSAAASRHAAGLLRARVHVVVMIHTVSGHAVRPVAAAFLHHYVVYPCQRRTGRSGIANRLCGWDCWRRCGNEWSVSAWRPLTLVLCNRVGVIQRLEEQCARGVPCDVVHEVVRRPVRGRPAARRFKSRGALNRPAACCHCRCRCQCQQ